MLERWEAVKGLFGDALELPPDERGAFLERACDGDAVLRQQVERLLTSHAGSTGFLETPVLDLLDPDLSGADTLRVGSRVGAYRILRPIGRGGMGVVYLAARADEAYDRQVALKVLQRGLETADIVRRFRRERQTLAGLDHPNVARLLDGGTTGNGLPYFVMDFVEGEPIDDYCASRRLPVEARLALFTTVCAAVHYAHQNLIVHRDLKPENILVTADGVPKLLDFGIAKVLQPDGREAPEVTRIHQRILTVEYASPEQVRGEPITTASDVYSLGVVLYELLAGRRPFDAGEGGTTAVERAICDANPERPSAIAIRGDEEGPNGDRSAARLRRRLAGDLDTIVMKALHKEPQRRYRSVEQLADDIRRHLDGLPVTARRDSFGYRLGKTIRRHRAVAAVTALLAVALAGGALATMYQARLAEAARARAERRFEEVRSLATSFLFDIHDAIVDVPGTTRARQLLVTNAVEYLDRLAGEAGDDRTLQHELAAAYQRVGDVQGHPTSANLGDLAGARESYRKAFALAGALAASDVTDRDARRRLAWLHRRRSDLDAWSGNLDAAIEGARRSLALFTGLAGPAADAGVRLDLAVAHIKLADVLGNPDFPNAGRREEALDHYRRARPILERLKGAGDDPSPRRYLGLIYERLGRMLEAQGDTAGALAQYRASLRVREPLAADYPEHTDAVRDLGVAHEKIGNMLRAGGDLDAALDSYGASLAIFETLAGADPANVNAQRSLSISVEKVGLLLLEMGRAPEALEPFGRTRALREALVRQEPLNRQGRHDLADAYEHLGEAHRAIAEAAGDPAARRARWRAARSWYRRSLAIWRELAESGGSADPAAMPRLAEAIAACDAALGSGS